MSQENRHAMKAPLAFTRPDPSVGDADAMSSFTLLRRGGWCWKTAMTGGVEPVRAVLTVSSQGMFLQPCNVRRYDVLQWMQVFVLAYVLCCKTLYAVINNIDRFCVLSASCAVLLRWRQSSINASCLAFLSGWQSRFVYPRLG